MPVRAGQLAGSKPKKTVCNVPVLGWLLHDWKKWPVVDLRSGWTVYLNRCKRCGLVHRKRAQL